MNYAKEFIKYKIYNLPKITTVLTIKKEVPNKKFEKFTTKEYQITIELRDDLFIRFNDSVIIIA